MPSKEVILASESGSQRFWLVVGVVEALRATNFGGKKSWMTGQPESPARPRRDSVLTVHGILVESALDARATTRGSVSGGGGTVYDDARGSGASSRSLTSRLLTNLIWNRSPSSSRVNGRL